MHIEHIYAVAREMEDWYGWNSDQEEPFTGSELEELEERLNEVFGEDPGNFREEGVNSVSL